MPDFEKKYHLAKSRAERLRKSARVSEELLEQRSRDLYLVNQQLEEAQQHLQEEVKQATYELNAANQRLRKSLKEKSHFIGAISHEIRTPLNAIVGYSELIESELPPGEIKDRAKIISQSAESMMSLLNDILEITQIDGGNIESVPSVVKVAENLDFINKMFQLQMREKGLEWKITTDNIPAFINIDIRRYNQILSNLVNNAYKYTQSGFVHLHCLFIQDAVNANQGVLKTSVLDSGEGVSESDQDIIFDLYQHIPKSNSISQEYTQRKQQDDVVLHSLGLGLPICKTLCQLMLGKIYCQSELGKGSEFSFELPVTIVNDANVETVQEAQHRMDNQTSDRPLRILVAEDTMLNQQVLKAQLSQLNQRAEIVDNGLLALDKLRENSYDLVILDILMPVMDGETTIRKIRASEPSIAEHYCVALTAASYQEKGQHLLDMGFDRFVSKPLTLNSLIDLIQSVDIHSKRKGKKVDEPKKVSNSIEGEKQLLPEIDMTFFEQQFGDQSAEVFARIVPTYISETKNNLQKLDDAFEKKDIKTLSFVAHAMKGEAKMFGFDVLADDLYQIESMSSMEDIQHVFPLMTSQLKHILIALEKRLS